MQRTRRRWILPPPEWVLAVVGVLLIGWYFLSMASAGLYQAHATRWFESLRHSDHAHDPVAAMAQRGAIVGRLDIPSIGMKTMVAEGTDAGTLRRAVGHWSHSPLPGRKGRSILAGHRDTFFRHLNRVHRGDVITLETPSGDVKYRVSNTAVIDPDNVEALRLGAPSGLTLVTCYPFHFIGPAPHRYIVLADRIDASPVLLAP